VRLDSLQGRVTLRELIDWEIIFDFDERDAVVRLGAIKYSDERDAIASTFLLTSSRA
jgi:hypothetical protein